MQRLREASTARLPMESFETKIETNFQSHCVDVLLPERLFQSFKNPTPLVARHR